VIGAQPDIEIVADTPDAPTNVAVLDVAALSTGLTETIERIRRQHPPARVLVLTTQDAPGCLEAALAAGATGYVLTPVPDQELLAAIRAVHRGRTFIDADQAGELATGRALPASAPGHARPRHPLSPREREVLVLLVRGFANREIARRLRVSVKTVETHRARLARKLGVHTRAGLVQYALLEGLLTVDAELSDTA